MNLRGWAGGLALASAAAACGGRSPYWNNAISATAASYGLDDAVALVDDPAHRVVMLTAAADGELKAQSLAVGHNVTSTAVSPDGRHLFVLAAGDTPRRKASDEGPSLTIVDTTTTTTTSGPSKTRYAMARPLANLAIDPLGRWAAAYSGQGAVAFVENPNEIVLFDLTAPQGSAPVSLTVRSFGGTPQRLTFTPPLQLPGGQRRLLVVETDIDVTLLDLDSGAPSPPQVTVRLTSGTNLQQVSPAGIVVDSFDPTSANDARIALRAAGDSNVYTLSLGPGASPGDDFTPKINLTDVGGVPSDIAWVRTDAGLRVAALVPSRSDAMLVDPDSSVTTQVALPAAYSKLSLVTSVTGGGSGTDVALLWNAGASSSSAVALWALGGTVGQPYASIELLSVSDPIGSVASVTPPNERLKVLEKTSDTGFFVLDLLSRQASPLNTQGRASLSISPDGLRMWAFSPGGTDLDSIDFATLSPVLLQTDPPIDAVYDIERTPATAGRSVVAIHRQGALGATVFDALVPDAAHPRSIPAQLLEAA